MIVLLDILQALSAADSVIREGSANSSLLRLMTLEYSTVTIPVDEMFHFIVSFTPALNDR
jgi:hypothetical protein